MLCAAAFYFLQRAGLFALAARLARTWSLPSRIRFDLDEARALDQRVRDLYRRRGALIEAGLWRFAGWVAGAGEVWLILLGLGHPIDFASAVMLESLGQVARTAAFVIPGGLGVQDGVLLLLATQLGIDAETALALALAKRCRELILGLPGLIVSYVILARRATAAGTPSGERPPI
jgi:uncharacterized membrane protein YbhN (UPF0104 family)